MAIRSQYLDLPDNWMEIPSMVSAINTAVYGHDRVVDRGILQTNLQQVEKVLGQLFEKSLNLEEVIQQSASGAGTRLDAPDRTFNLLGALNDVESLLNDNTLKIYNTKKNEAQRLLVDFGGLGVLQADDAISGLSRSQDRTGATISQDVGKLVSDNFRSVIGDRRKLLDIESSLRNNRVLTSDQKTFLSNKGLDENSALEDIQNEIKNTSGLEEARTGSIQAGQEQRARTEGQQAIGDQFSNVESAVERASIQTGIDVNRSQQIQDNINNYIQQTGSSLEEAKQWALQGKDLNSPDARAIDIIVSGLPATAVGVAGVDGTVSPAGTAGTTGAEGLVGGAGTLSEAQAGLRPDQKLSEAFAFIDQADLDADTKSLFKQVVQNWDLNQELNFDNVLKEFKRVQTETIDPFFKEKVNTFTRDATDAINQEKLRRELEKEEEQTIFGERERAAKQSLEARGLTFSGEGVRQLGEKSAFAREGSEAATAAGTPLQKTEGGTFQEGIIPKSSRLIASGSLARNRARMEAIGKSAEQALGTQAATGLVGGFTPTTGGIATGTIEQQRQSQLGGTLSQIAGQQRQNVKAQNPVEFN